MDSSKISPGLLKIYEKVAQKSRASGEPGEEIKVRDKLPNDIEQALINRFITAGIPLPKFGYTGI
jgi:hypothetical protein